MSETTKNILDSLYDMMQQTHRDLTHCKTDADKMRNRGRFEALCEVQDMIREVMEDEP